MTPYLRFGIHEINRIAGHYQYPISETDLMARKEEVSQRGHLTKDDLASVAYWKSPRSSRHARKNREDYVAEITRFAFYTN